MSYQPKGAMVKNGSIMDGLDIPIQLHRLLNIPSITEIHHKKHNYTSNCRKKRLQSCTMLSFLVGLHFLSLSASKSTATSPHLVPQSILATFPIDTRSINDYFIKHHPHSPRPNIHSFSPYFLSPSNISSDTYSKRYTTNFKILNIQRQALERYYFQAGLELLPQKILFFKLRYFSHLHFFC